MRNIVLSFVVVIMMFSLPSSSVEAGQSNNLFNGRVFNLTKDSGGSLRSVFHCKSEKLCVIKWSPGGDVGKFITAALEALATDTQVQVEGVCASACVIFADIARKNICITDNAVFEFHKATQFEAQVIGSIEVMVPTRRYNQPQSPDIDNWVRAHGGYPYDGVNSMFYKDALQFWKRCK